MVYPWGIIRHFALLGIELFKARTNFDFFFASIQEEPDRNAWRIVYDSIPDASIISGESFSAIVEKCEELFARYKGVLIHCGGGWGQTKAFIPLRKKFGRRLILVGTTHSYRNGSWMRIPMSIFQCYLYLRYYDKIVFQCKYAAEKFCGSWLLFALKKSTIIPLGCERFGVLSDAVPLSIATNKLLAEILVDSDTFIFVYLAAFRPGKKHAWLVRAVAPILREHSDVRLLLCGTGERSVIDDVRRSISELKLENQILLTGQIQREDVPWVLKHSNCAIVPSQSETFGHNFLEPMFAGLPVLGTRVGIGCDIIKDGMTGWFFSLRSEKSLQIAVQRIIQDRARSAVMGKRAEDLVSREFTHTAVASRLICLYDDMLNI